MAQYINKSALIAEIEKIIPNEPYPMTSETLNGAATYGKRKMCFEILNLINALEAKEVDLEEALSNLDKDIKEFVATEEFENESTTKGHYWVIAKHAFLLGLNYKTKTKC